MTALNLSQIFGTGKLLMADDNHNIRNDSSKKHFMWGNSSELKSENSKISLYGSVYITTQLKPKN